MLVNPDLQEHPRFLENLLWRGRPLLELIHSAKVLAGKRLLA